MSITTSPTTSRPSSGTYRRAITRTFTNNLWSSNSYPTTTTLLKNDPKLYYAQLNSTSVPSTVNSVSLGYTDQPLDLSLQGNYKRAAKPEYRAALSRESTKSQSESVFPEDSR